jgi:hypothetical protein
MVMHGSFRERISFPIFRPMMSEVSPWSERKLDFTRPVGELPLLAERMLGTTDRIQALVRNLAPERLQLRIQGKWSVFKKGDVGIYMQQHTLINMVSSADE